MDETARISKSLFKRKTATKNSVDPTLNSPVAKPVLPSKTTAEMAFEALQRKRLLQKAKQSKSHKEKIADFNKKLETMSEHYDIPKVGPG